MTTEAEDHTAHLKNLSFEATGAIEAYLQGRDRDVDVLIYASVHPAELANVLTITAASLMVALVPADQHSTVLRSIREAILRGESQ